MKKLILTILALFIVFEASRSSELGGKWCIALSEKVVFIPNNISEDVYGILAGEKIDDRMRLQYMTVKDFKETLAFHESRGDYKIINRWGFRGAYQFSPFMIRKFGNTTPSKFLSTPTIQERAMSLACAFYIKYIYDYGYDKYIGKEIGGVTITLESLMLGLHFSPSYLKEWVESNGQMNRRDANISVGAYMKKFENRGERKVIREVYCPLEKIF